VPALVPGSSDSTTATPAPATTPSAPFNDSKLPPSEPVQGKPAGMSTQQTLGIIVAGVGVAGIGVGSYFGVRAIQKNSDAESDCPNSGLCNTQNGVDLTEQAKDNATIANVGFGVGLGLVAAGAILYFTGGSKEGDRVAFVPSVAPGAAGANLVGRF
jgi:serine/threonine-protein kinase